MQDTVIMAFRKRLKKRGYTEISIKKIKDSANYIVTAIEPLARLEVSIEYPIVGMHHSFRF